MTTENLVINELKKTDQEWFERDFVRAFFSVYKDKSFNITKDGNDHLVGVDDKSNGEKRLWLEETAKEEFHDYAINPKQEQKSLVIRCDDQPAGVLLYNELTDENTIYLAQAFISPEYQRKGFYSKLIESVLSNSGDRFDRVEVLARPQNDIALNYYKKVGFVAGNKDIVEKYGYSPNRYASFYKILK